MNGIALLRRLLLPHRMDLVDREFTKLLHGTIRPANDHAVNGISCAESDCYRQFGLRKIAARRHDLPLQDVFPARVVR